MHSCGQEYPAHNCVLQNFSRDGQHRDTAIAALFIYQFGLRLYVLAAPVRGAWSTHTTSSRRIGLIPIWRDAIVQFYVLAAPGRRTALAITIFFAGIGIGNYRKGVRWSRDSNLANSMSRFDKQCTQLGYKRRKVGAGFKTIALSI